MAKKDKIEDKEATPEPQVDELESTPISHIVWDWTLTETGLTVYKIDLDDGKILEEHPFTNPNEHIKYGAADLREDDSQVFVTLKYLMEHQAIIFKK